MKIKLDENLPASLAETLRQAGHDTDTVPEEGLTGQPDQMVWQASQQSGRLLITQDLDFSDIHQYQPGTHHGILLIRLAEPSRSQLLMCVRQLIQTEDLESWSGCFVVATERKVRIRRPGP